MSAIDSIRAAFEDRGFPWPEAVTVIWMESGWKPHALNTWAPPGGKPSYAAGLTQMMPRTLRALGWDKGPHAYAQLSAAEQAPWIARMLRGVRMWQVPGDTYLALFMPAAVGAPDTLVLGRPGSAVWKSNPGLREGSHWQGKRLVPGEGPITAGSVRQVMLDAMGSRFPLNPPAVLSRPLAAPAEKSRLGLVLLGLALLFWPRRAERR